VFYKRYLLRHQSCPPPPVDVPTAEAYRPKIRPPPKLPPPKLRCYLQMSVVLLRSK
jgi:hypothetical protein